jgi:hypothetical protein
MPGYDDRVFINVRFDRRYKKLFDALVFTVHDCGFLAHCALESDDGSRVRLDKLYAIIAECRYGIHDLSRVTLDTRYRLPRFNMPLELGIFTWGKKILGGKKIWQPATAQVGFDPGAGPISLPDLLLRHCRAGHPRPR